MEQNPNQNLSPAVTHQPSLLGGAENMKLLFDITMNAFREGVNSDRAWEAFKLRIAHNSATFDHLTNMVSLTESQIAALAAQAGVTEGQQTVSPVRTAAGDNLAAGAAPANRIMDTTGAVAAGVTNMSGADVAAALGQLAQALVPIVLASTGTVSAESLASLLPIVVAAAGKGSAQAAGATTPPASS